MVLAGAQIAVQNLVESAEQRLAEGLGPAAPAPEPHDARSDVVLQFFHEAGRDHVRRDRPLRTLLTAYQTGGRVAWRHIAAIAVARGLSAQTLAALAEGVFRAIDLISAATTSGFLQEQSESAEMREQLRNALAEQLLAGGADAAELEELAERAGWPLPDEAAVVLMGAEDRAALTAMARLAHTGLQVRSTPLPVVIVRDAGAPGVRHRLTALLRGCPALVGPAVPLETLPESARLVQDAAWALDLPIAVNSPFFVDEHLDTIIVHRDPRLLDALRVRCLAPLQRAAPASRDPFQDTLRSWLVHMGDRRSVAADLQIHPQTVRYRMSRLHELFGPVLDDPAGRLRLLLALAWDEPVGSGRGSCARRTPGAQDGAGEPRPASGPAVLGPRPGAPRPVVPTIAAEQRGLQPTARTSRRARVR